MLSVIQNSHASCLYVDVFVVYRTTVKYVYTSRRDNFFDKSVNFDDFMTLLTALSRSLVDSRGPPNHLYILTMMVSFYHTYVSTIRCIHTIGL